MKEPEDPKEQVIMGEEWKSKNEPGKLNSMLRWYVQVSLSCA